MIDIEMNGTKLKVTKGAYKSIFKPAGWNIVNGNAFDMSEGAGMMDAENHNDNGMIFEEIKKIPVSNMTDAQIKMVADYLKINMEGKRRNVLNKEIAEALAEDKGWD